MSNQYITDWLVFRPAGVVSPPRTYVDLPSFSYVGQTWKGASQIITQFNFSASKNFILLNTPTKPTNANYLLCIRYRVGDIVYRYKLWDHSDAQLNNVPTYVNQLIKKNFVLEVWNISTSTTVSQSTSIRMFTSVRQPLTIDLRVRTDQPLALGTECNDLQNVDQMYSNLAPADLSDNLAYWFDAAYAEHAYDIHGIADVVSSWTDRTGKIKLVNKGSGAVKFLPSVTEFNNKPALDFGFYDAPKFEIEDSTLVKCCDMFIVMRQKAWVDGAHILTNGDVLMYQGSLAFSEPVIGLTTTYGISSTIYASLDPLSVLYNPNIVINNPFIFYGGISRKVDLQLLIAAYYNIGLENGNEQTYGFVGDANARPLYIGGGANFEIAELIGFNGLRTSDDNTKVQAYLKNKYASDIALPIDFNVNSAWLDNP